MVFFMLMPFHTLYTNMVTLHIIKITGFTLSDKFPIFRFPCKCNTRYSYSIDISVHYTNSAAHTNS